MAFICPRKAIRISKTVWGFIGGSIGSKSTFRDVARISSVHNSNSCSVRRWWEGYITTKFFPTTFRAHLAGLSTCRVTVSDITAAQLSGGRGSRLYEAMRNIRPPEKKTTICSFRDNGKGDWGRLEIQLWNACSRDRSFVDIGRT